MSLTYKLKGLDKFIRRVEYKQKSVRVAVDAELSKSANRVEKQAKILAPVDTGWLRTQIYNEQQKLLNVFISRKAVSTVIS